MKSTQGQIKPAMRLGVHVSIAGRLSQAVERAEALGCTAMQIFSRSPRGWFAKALEADEVEKFQAARGEAGISPVAVHASYLINLASSQPALFDRSVAALKEELDRADRLGAEYVVVHVGSCGGEPAGTGIKRIVKALQQVLNGKRRFTQLLLENTAGEQGDVGSRIEELDTILHRLNGQDKLGLCLDTCHLFAAGYDIREEAGVTALAKMIERNIGVERVRLVHLNDSKKGLGCRVDRHQHIGQGGIGLEGFRAWVNHPAFRQIPMILETPKDTPEADPRNLRIIRRLAGLQTS